MAILVLVLCSSVQAGAQRGAGSDSDSPARHATKHQKKWVPGELLVRYRPGVTASQRAAVRTRADVRFKQRVRLARTELVKLSGGQSVAEADRFLSAQPEVQVAEPNFYRYARAVPPGPPTNYDAYQWALENDGTQAVNGHPVGTADADIDAEGAWDVTNGDPSSRVAVIDSGVDHKHPSLDDNVELAAGYDFVDNDTDPRDLISGHGTHVAGIISAEPDVASGGGEMSGVNWDTTIVPVRALGDDGGGTNAAIIDSIDWAASTEIGFGNAKVVNMSLGSSTPSALERAAFAAHPDVLFVVASDNGQANSSTVGDYPCDYTLRNIICVAASDNNDSKASFSNWGSASVDIAAPGKDIYSTLPGYAVNEEFGADVTNVGTVDGDTTNDDPSSWVPGLTAGTAWGYSSSNGDLEDSVDDGYYDNNSNTWIASPEYDLSGRDAGTCKLGFYIETYLDTDGPFDFVYVQYNTDGGSTWTSLDIPGVGSSFDGEFVGDAVIPLSFTYSSTVRFRWRLQTDGSVLNDGAYLDDVRISCDDDFGTYGTAFGFMSGTSMATPHVAGVGGLLYAQYPGADPIWVREAILEGGDDVPGGSNWITNPFHTATDRRLNAGGSLTWAAANATAPTEPRLVSPAEDASSTNKTPTFTWAPSGSATGVTGYRIYFDGELASDITTSIDTASTLSYGSTTFAIGYHTWKVVAYDASGETASVTREFRIVGAPTVTVKMSSAGGAAKSCGTTAAKACLYPRKGKKWMTGFITLSAYTDGTKVTTRVYKKTAGGGWALNKTFSSQYAAGGFFPDDAYAFGYAFGAGKYRVRSVADASELTVSATSAYRYFTVS